MSEEKSETAYRSISEVASSLNVETHVLRFWETKFDIIQPLKRAAGRRFYRPEDVQLIAGIRCLLHEDGLTIKGKLNGNIKRFTTKSTIKALKDKYE